MPAEAAGPILKQYVCTVPATAPFFDAKFADQVEAFLQKADRHPVFRLVSDEPS